MIGIRIFRRAIPKGVIVLWSGAVADIPGGWYLCDGTNGTPDLSGRFVVSQKAGIQAPGDIIGKHMQTATFTSNNHTHQITATMGGPVVGNLPGRFITSNVKVSGATDLFDNRPSSYVMAFIMKG